MLENIQDFVQTWGYVAVFLGAMVEGESIIFLAGLSAQKGYLCIYTVTFVAFLGTLIADQTLYFIGRHYGRKILDRFPSLHDKVAKAFHLLHRYDNFFILIFRFIYGIRILSPIVIGASGIPVKRFIILNFLAAIIWSVLSCTAAFFLAHVLLTYWHVVSQVLLGALIFGAVLFYGIYLWRKKRRK